MSAQNRRPGLRRYLAAALGVTILSVSLTSCDSSSGGSQAAASQVLHPLTTQTASPSAPGPATPSTVRDGNQVGGSIGSFKVSTAGETVTTDVTVDAPQLGNQSRPPTDVLDGCNWDYSSVIATSVFVHGSLTIHYGGTVPGQVQITPGAAVTSLGSTMQLGAGTAGTVGVASPDGSSWDLCGGSYWTYELQPDTTTSVDWWADLQVISNAHPTFTQEDQRGLAVNWYAFGSDQLGVTPTVSGSDAASCAAGSQDQAPYLLLYGQPPENYEGQDVNGTAVDESCTAP